MDQNYIGMKKQFKNFIYLLTRQKSVFGLAVGSLSIGISVVLLIGLWVYTEFNFDTFHQKREDIYRMYKVDRNHERSDHTFRQIGDNMRERYPEVKDVCRFTWGYLELRKDGKLVPAEGLIQAEDNFFTFFSFPLKTGDAETCLSIKNQMVISEKMANILFGNEDPVGKLLQGDGNDYIISAVMENIPYNSHIQADIVIPFYGKYRDFNCGGDVFRTYLYIPGLTDRGVLDTKLTNLLHETNSLAKEAALQYKLEALRDIHFGGAGSAHSGSKSLVIMLIIIAFAILLIACINFVNLYIAISFLKVKEIGVKKTYGASRMQLMKGVFKETSMFILLSEGIAVLLAVLFLPLFNQLATCYLELNFASPFLYIYLAVVYVFILLVAGAYPAFYMTRFNVLQTLSGKFKGKKLSYLQSSLLIIQFTVSVGFLMLIFFVHKQVNYMTSYDLGFDKEHIVCVEASGSFKEHYNTVRDELLREPSIKEVTVRDGFPMYWADGYPITKPGSNDRVQLEICQVGYNYLEMMNIELVEGENPFFNNQIKTEMVIDENAVKQLELKEPIGAILEVWGYKFIVKGVARNILSKNLKEQDPKPVAYLPLMDWEGCQSIMMCKVAGNPREGIEAIQKQWETYMTDPFNYEFLDDLYKQQYESETRLGNIFLCAMAIMFLLSVSGLFAIAYYTMQRRLKEIGIRKVNGATFENLLWLLNLKFVRLVVMSCILAGIFAYSFLDYWLKQFVVKTTLSWWVYVGAACLALMITVLTVSYLTIRAARTNPVEVLKSE